MTTMRFPVYFADDKTGGNVNIRDMVEYEITSPLPLYTKSANNKTYQISDTLLSGLIFDASSMEVYLDNKLLTDGIEYTMELGMPSSEPTFTLYFDYRKLESKNGGKIEGTEIITVIYTAFLNGSPPGKQKLYIEGQECER